MKCNSTRHVIECFVQLLNGHLMDDVKLKVAVADALLTIKIMDKDCVRYDWEKSLEGAKERLRQTVLMLTTLVASVKLIEENADIYNFEAMRRIMAYADTGTEIH